MMSVMVVKKLLKAIILSNGLPVLLGLDNRPAFNSQVAQKLVRAMGTNWKLHCTYVTKVRPGKKDKPNYEGDFKQINP